tara:strand:+ start:9 stop:749 length:741 start_codon:yes stop_codon:yes gene_type:complete
MATVTASLSLTSADLTTNGLAVSTSTNLVKAGTKKTGLSQTTGVATRTTSFASAGVIDSSVLYRGDDYTADGANKVYLKNLSLVATEYFTVYLTGSGGTDGGGVTELGRLYAGDFAFFPWNATGGTKETFIATIDNTWAAGDTWEFDGVEITAADSTVANIATLIDEAHFPNWVTSRSTAAVTFVARYAQDAGTVVTATADITVVTAGDGDSVVSSSALGTKSLSDIWVKPSVHTEITLEHLLIHE